MPYHRALRDDYYAKRFIDIENPQSVIREILNDTNLLYKAAVDGADLEISSPEGVACFPLELKRFRVSGELYEIALAGGHPGHRLLRMRINKYQTLASWVLDLEEALGGLDNDF